MHTSSISTFDVHRADENWPFAFAMERESEQVSATYEANWYIHSCTHMRRNTTAAAITICDERHQTTFKLAHRKCITFGFGSISNGKWSSNKMYFFFFFLWDDFEFLEANKRQIDLLRKLLAEPLGHHIIDRKYVSLHEMSSFDSITPAIKRTHSMDSCERSL